MIDSLIHKHAVEININQIFIGCFVLVVFMKLLFFFLRL